MRQLSNLLKENRIIKVDDDIDWVRWHEFMLKYHMNGASMRNLVTGHTTMLKLKGENEPR